MMMVKMMWCILLVTLLMTGPITGRPKVHLPLNQRSFLRNTRSHASVQDGRSIRMVKPLDPETITSPFNSLVLECEVGGDAPFTIHWLKGGKRLSKEHDMGYQSVEDVAGKEGLVSIKSRLFLDCVQPSDLTTYSCVAESPVDRKVSSTLLKVEVSPIITGTNQDPFETNIIPMCESKKSFGSPARISTFTNHLLEVQGLDAVLVCRSQGFPKPVTSWFNLQGQPINTMDSDKYSVTNMGDLIIKDITFEDMGVYECVSSNGIGEPQSVKPFLYPLKPETK